MYTSYHKILKNTENVLARGQLCLYGYGLTAATTQSLCNMHKSKICSILFAEKLTMSQLELFECLLKKHATLQ